MATHPIPLRPTRRCGLLLLAAFAAGPAQGSCTEGAFVTSSSRVCTTFPGCLEVSDIEFGGEPAQTSRSNGVQDPPSGFNYTVSAAMTHAFGSFTATNAIGGANQITESGVAFGNTTASGLASDCLTFGGGTGAALARLPIHLAASATIEWSIGGAYVPPPESHPAQSELRVTCGIEAAGSFPACNDIELRWFESETLDTTVELVFPVTFGVPTTLRLAPELFSRLGVSPNGTQTGTLLGVANATVEAALRPMILTDSGGSPLPGATIVATSGFDYATAPEPGHAGACAALLALGALRRRLGHGRDVQPRRHVRRLRQER